MAGLTMNRKALKLANYKNLLRLAKYLGLKAVSDMSDRQLASLVWWRIKPKYRE